MLDSERIERELRRLNERLTRVEGRLGLSPFDQTQQDDLLEREAEIVSRPTSPQSVPTPPAIPVSTPPTAPAPGLHETLAHWAEQRKTRSAEPPPSAPTETTALSVETYKMDPFFPPPAGTPPFSAPTQPASSEFRPPLGRKEAKGPLELQIGMRWMAWAGALVVIVAVGFFVKLAFDLGWWGHLSKQARCLLAAGFGGLLVAGGEIALRRINRAAATSLFAAGLGTLYLTAYATFRYFNLISESTAFMLLAGVALLGFGLTVRGRMLSIGVLSLLAGYFGPFLLQGASTFVAALPLYMTMLLAVALALSAFLPQPFRKLRYVALSLHGFLGMVWILGARPEHFFLTLGFLVLWWVMATTEAIYAARRQQSALGNAVVCLAATGWFVTLHCRLLQAHPAIGTEWLGLSVACIAVLTFLIAFRFDRRLATLRGLPQTALDKLALTHWVECATLLAVAVALQFEGFGQTIGWLAMGLAYVEMGRRLPSRGVDRFGLLLGALALVRLITVDSLEQNLRLPLWIIGEITVTRWSLLALTAIAATHVAARRLRVEGERPRVGAPIVICGISVLGWLGLCALQCQGLTITVGWLAAAIVLLSLERFGQRQRYFAFGVFALAATAGRWLAVDAFGKRMDLGWQATAAWPLFNAQMLVAALLCAAGGWIAWQYFARVAAGAVETQAKLKLSTFDKGRAFLTMTVVLFLVALSFEIDRWIGRWEAAATWHAVWPALQLRGLWWTALWGAGALTLLAGSLQLRKTLSARLSAQASNDDSPAVRRTRTVLLAAGPLRRDGWVLLLAAAIAWLTYDTFMWRLQTGPVPVTVFFNLQFGVGAALLLALAFAVWRERKIGAAPRTETALSDGAADAAFGAPQSSRADQFFSTCITLALVFLATFGLWLGSFEIDRLCAPEAGRFLDGAMARQTGLSIYWGIYAILLLAVGFRRRAAWCRYAGLALLSLTLLKVLIVDMAQVRYFYRVLSLLGVGLLLIGTSVAYAKLASRLLGERGPTPPRESERPSRDNIDAAG